jgi:transposase
MLQQVWAGVDIGKTHHHVVVIDAEGRRLLSRRVANDETVLLALFSEVAALADRVIWAVDVKTSGAVLLLALLLTHDQRVLYISGHMINRAADGYRGQGKTDARDAAIIADQARIRRDLSTIQAEDELVVELRMLVARRQDLVADRTRTVNRLRDQLLTICPALERALEITNKGPLIEGRFRHHELAEVITSMPGIGVVLGAEFLAATGGSMSAFASADHLAGYAGLAPVPKDSGKISGNLHRPRRYHRGLQRAFYTSALISVWSNHASGTLYDRKRAEGKLHGQAVMALARRRVNVLWALIRDRRCYQTPLPESNAA